MIIETAQLLSCAIRALYGEQPLTVAMKKAAAGTKQVMQVETKLQRRKRKFDKIGLYGISHFNHPMAKWARTSETNFLWLLLHGFAIANEYHARYGISKKKVHACFPTLVVVLNFWSERLKGSRRWPERGLTVPPECMPDQYKWAGEGTKTLEDVVESYRRYYLGEKTGFAKWNHSEAPAWWVEARAASAASAAEGGEDEEQEGNEEGGGEGTEDGGEEEGTEDGGEEGGEEGEEDSQVNASESTVDTQEFSSSGSSLDDDEEEIGSVAASSK